MNGSTLHQQKLSGRLAAMLLAFWVAGVGCFMGCCADVAAASNPVGTTQITSTNTAKSSCPMHPEVHGSTSNEARVNSLPSVAIQSDSLSAYALPLRPEVKACCPLMGQATTEPRTIRFKSPDTVAATQHFSINAAIQTWQAASLARGSERVVDRGRTYLRHCVFLI